MNQNVKVYQVNDMEWWATDTIENLLVAYEEECGEEIILDDLEECDIDSEGMYYSFENNSEADIMIKIIMKYLGKDKNHIELELDDKKYQFCQGDGNSIHVSFRRAIELDGEYIKPYLIAGSEY